jgi:structural maintenance of chromosome 2
MRPKDILGMVEEAAGTRMFEERKDKAKKTMGKKEKRVDEITALLAEEITPKLDTLRAERRAFMQYQKANAELERLARVLRAYEWTDHRAKVSRKDAQISDRERDIAQARREKERAVREAGVAEKNRHDVQAQRDRELKKGGKVTRMEEEAKELEKAVVKLHTQAELKEGTIKDEETAREASGRELSEVRASVSVSTSVILFSHSLMHKPSSRLRSRRNGPKWMQPLPSTMRSKKSRPQRRTRSPRLRTSSRHSSQVWQVLLPSQPVEEDTWARLRTPAPG